MKRGETTSSSSGHSRRSARPLCMAKYIASSRPCSMFPSPWPRAGPLKMRYLLPGSAAAAFAGAAETEVLQLVDDPASLVWIWVASLVGRMAQDGEIPGMPTPTYGRIMNLVQEAHGG